MEPQHLGIKKKTIALIGNPNSGKTSVFNLLTGLRQKTGNFPGVTVDKKFGTINFKNGKEVLLLDLPGTYSLYPNSGDEKVAVENLLCLDNANMPDMVLFIANITKLKSHLLLFSQLKDLGLPIILVLNMADLAKKEGYEVDVKGIEKKLGVPVYLVSGRTQEGVKELKLGIEEHYLDGDEHKMVTEPLRKMSDEELSLAKEVKAIFPNLSDYKALLYLHHKDWLSFISKANRLQLGKIIEKSNFNSLQSQVVETMQRFEILESLLQSELKFTHNEGVTTFTRKIDRILTHKILGPAIFFVLMFFVFQAIFTWASYPMNLIDNFTSFLIEFINNNLPDNGFRSFLGDGLIAGLGGILIFVPQIAILFLLLAILEEVGYMARGVYLFDRIMKIFGLNGKSIVALISGGACAVPAVMSARTISNPKERLITILVTPFISCSARIPVYAILIAFAIPDKTIWGFVNLQGLAFSGLYLLGVLAALLFAFVLKVAFGKSEQSFLVMELPDYKAPILRNILLTVWEKVKTFVVEAGKIILLISMVLWALASYGPSGTMEKAEQMAKKEAATNHFTEAQTENLIASKQLEASYAGYIGKVIEPAVRPLGYDWKIGIALITSFAAREVFVGTMSTIYSLGSDADKTTIRNRMQREIDPKTGEPVYNLATSISLLIFYVFAMMCMSTLAMVKRETNSWKWPILQFVVMTALAYISAFGVYHWLS